ncbi:MAG: IS630 family transposase [Planctomycetota bacterium]|nr:MAG: IS630 family transposase [Planctomycetota bacterium]
MKKRYRVTLTAAEREQLSRMRRRGRASARALVHAGILLKADEGEGGPGWNDARIAEALDCGTATVERVRKRFVEEGLEAAFRPRPTTRTYLRKLDGKGEARLIALACSDPPEGHARWSLRLLADRLVALGMVDAISHETVRRTLKKNELTPWLRKGWCIPPKQDAAFVAHMEDVLEVYHRPYDARRPVVCMDETPKQLIGEVRPPQPGRRGRASRYDVEYVRNGTANVFLAFEPLAGRRHVRVTDTRTRRDWARFMQELLDGPYAQAERVVLVMDQLNTHSIASFYEAFEPGEARRLAERLEIHDTPKHGSWLNMAEIELSALGRQCLDRRIPEKTRMEEQVHAWTKKRNSTRTRVNWRFTTQDARIRLRTLYPSIQP